MNVLIAVHHFPPNYTSGAELRAYRTAAWMRDHGHDVHVVCVESIDASNGQGLAYEDDIYDGLPVRRLAFDLPGTPDPFRWAYDNPWIGQHLRGYLAELGPDVLHLISGYLMSGSTIRAAHALNIPTVVTLTDFWFLCPRITLLRSNGRICFPPIDAVTCARCLGEEKRRYRIPARLLPGLMIAFWRAQRGRVQQIRARMVFLQETLDSVGAIISPSQFLRNLFVEAGIEEERIVCSRQGCSFSASLSGMLEKMPASRLRIGYMGQVKPHKGVHVLVRAVRNLPTANLQLAIYGNLTSSPAYVRRLRKLAAGDERIIFAGTYCADELSRIMAGTDVVIVPSIWYENSPNVILEAQAYRTPVIVSALGGMAELVRDEVDGLYFAPGDASDLARQLQRFLDEPSLLSSLAASAPPVKHLDAEMSELEAAYRSVIE